MPFQYREKEVFKLKNSTGRTFSHFSKTLFFLRDNLGRTRQKIKAVDTPKGLQAHHGLVCHRKAAGPKQLRRSSTLPLNQTRCSSNPGVELHKRFTELGA